MSDYAWVDDIVAVTITFVRGLELREVGDLLGFQWSTEREATFGDAEWQHVYATGTYPVQVADLDGWVVLVEPNGYLASIPATLVSLSRAGTAISVFWNVNAVMRFLAAWDGVLVRSFDPLLFEVDQKGDPLPQEEGLLFGWDGTDTRQQALALELTERLTGIRIDKYWLLEVARRTWSATGPARP